MASILPLLCVLALAAFCGTNATAFFTLETLWFLAQTSGLPTFSDYFKAAKQQGVPIVSFNERPLILAWLRGETDSLALLSAAPSKSAPVSAVSEIRATAGEAAARRSDAVDMLALPSAHLSAEERKQQRERAQRLEERAAALLAQHSGAEAPGGNSEEALSGDVLQRLREKFKERKSLKTGDDDLERDASATAQDEELLAASRRVLAAVRAREVPANSSARALQAPTFKFEKMLKSVHEMREKELTERQQQQTQAYDRVRQMQAQQHDRYNVDSSAVFTGMAKDLAEIGIDTGASMLSRGLSAPSPVPAASPAPRSSVHAHSSSKRGREEGELDDGPSPKRARSKSTSSSSASVPIILVPERYLLSTRNAKQWLEDAVFTADSGGGGGKAPGGVDVVRSAAASKSGVLQYRVVHDGSALSSADWERVVAVFVQGQTWQFKGWKYSTPAELFGRVKGYYLHYDDQKVPPEIKSWNVRPLAVSRTNEHSGAKAAAIFWAEVDDFLILKRAK